MDIEKLKKELCHKEAIINNIKDYLIQEQIIDYEHDENEEYPIFKYDMPVKANELLSLINKLEKQYSEEN